MISDTPMKDLVIFVTVTTDPLNDTADAMRGYGTAHGLDPANWLFLTSCRTSRRASHATSRRLSATDSTRRKTGFSCTALSPT
jgi:protein SCO1/2